MLFVATTPSSLPCWRDPWSASSAAAAAVARGAIAGASVLLSSFEASSGDPVVRAVSYLSVVQDLRDIARDRSFKHVYICFRRRLSPVAKASAKELSASYSAQGSIPAASAVEYHSVRTPARLPQLLPGTH